MGLFGDHNQWETVIGRFLRSNLVSPAGLDGSAFGGSFNGGLKHGRRGRKLQYSSQRLKATISLMLFKPIIKSIDRELGDNVETLRWARVLAAKPGTRDTTEKDLQKTAYRWLRRKRCDLLVSGRVKTGNIGSPLDLSPQRRALAQQLQYSSRTLSNAKDRTFIADLGVAIAANVTASVKDAVESRKYIVPTLQTPSVRLDTANSPDTIRVWRRGFRNLNSLQCACEGQLV